MTKYYLYPCPRDAMLRYVPVEIFCNSRDDLLKEIRELYEAINYNEDIVVHVEAANDDRVAVYAYNEATDEIELVDVLYF